jgi:hypothetical protein
MHPTVFLVMYREDGGNPYPVAIFPEKDSMKDWVSEQCPKEYYTWEEVPMYPESD